MQSRVIVNSTTQQDVVGKVAESGISAGGNDCRSTPSIDQHCGNVVHLDLTVTTSGYTDPDTGLGVTRSIRHNYCFDEFLVVPGDSGSPAYRYATGGVKAMGLISNGSPSLGDCFSPQSRIANGTGSTLVLA